MARSVRVTPEEFAAKHIRRTQAATQDMQAGVLRVDQAPGKKAAASVDKMRANLMAAIDSGKWQRRVGSVSLDDWKKAMVDKGIPRVSAGLEGSRDKIRAFGEKLIAYQNSILPEIDAMPSVTLEDNINRMTTFVRKMSKFER